MLIAIVIDTNKLAEQFNSRGLSLELLDDQNSAMMISYLGDPISGSEETETWVSRHLFDRLFAEFLSLEWHCSQIARLAKNAGTDRIGDFNGKEPVLNPLYLH